jgi:penicillin-binding protein 2
VAALSLGVITESTTFNCRGYYQTPGELRCDLRSGHGEIAVHAAIQRSCNVFFNNVGAHMGLERLSDWFGRFGYADSPGTGLPEERAGLLPDPRRKQDRREALMLAMGQGKVEITPLHAANAMAAIARGGEFLSPILVQELADRQKRWRIPATPAALACVQDALRAAVNDPGGTGYNYVRDSEIEICGKTGTAQTSPRWIDRNHDGKRQEDEILRAGDTAWFVGYAPYRHPQLAFAVVVEYSDAHGGTAAGPIALEAMRLCKKMGYLK